MGFRRYGTALIVVGFVGCADVLGLPELSARSATDPDASSLDAASAGPACRPSARVCMGPLQPRVCAPHGDWVDEAPCASGVEECESDTATCVRCGAKPADVGTWRVASPAVAASARYFAAAAYDATRRQIVMFGGLPPMPNGAALAGTWVWNGSTWSGALPMRSPSRRFAAAMVADTARGELVLFGGEDYRYAMESDTWVWNGAEASWTQRCGAGQERCGPGPRMMHAMAYDEDRRSVVMFGGGKVRVDVVPAPVGPALSDTWEWDGSSWRETCGETSGTPCAVPGLRGASMTYDPIRKRIVLYGGEGDEARLIERVWEYDGATWSRRDEIANVPPPRSFASLTYDTARARIVLHGGVAGLGGASLSDTWEFDGNCWKDVTNLAALAPARDFFASSYDIPRAELVTFGGVPPNSRDATDTTSIRSSPGPVR